MKLRNIFSRNEVNCASSAVQTAPRESSIPSLMKRYTPLMPRDARLYESMRASVPIIDAAIDKIVRLTGGFSVKCADEALQEDLSYFLKTVKVGTTQSGIDSFIATYLDQLLLYGTAVAEIVPSVGCRDIAALYNASLEGLDIVAKNDSLNAVVCRREPGAVVPAPYQQLIMYSALKPEPGETTGNSILKSMPFMVDTLMKIYGCIGKNFERMGNLRYAVTYKPTSDSDRVSAKDRAYQIAEQWTNAMKSDEVRDFIAVGDVDIKVIGADSQMLSTEIPVKQILEQIVAKTGLPPFLLGLSWSSTERMSTQQADLLTSELEYYRSILTPVVLRICNVWQLMRGRNERITVEWDCINLQDEVELAKAELYRAQAAQIESSMKGE